MTKVPLVSIVDDDMSVREATVGLLESYGYATSAFASAEEFLQSGQLESTSCLVTDVRMPGVSGLDLQRQLLQAGHRIPTVVISAHQDEHVRVAALECGALGFLTKPVQEDSLIAYIEKALCEYGEGGIAH